MTYHGKHRVPKDDRRQQAIDDEHTGFEKFCKKNGLNPKSADSQRAYTAHLRSERVH